MKNQYEDYNSLYPLAYYDLGKVYAFYGATSVCAEPATDEQVQTYAAAFDGLDNSTQMEPIGTARKLHRHYAVVVEKGADSIVVMFPNKNNGKIGYLTKKYTIDTGCNTDGMDLMTVFAVAGYPIDGTPRLKETPVAPDSEPGKDDNKSTGLDSDSPQEAEPAGDTTDGTPRLKETPVAPDSEPGKDDNKPTGLDPDSPQEA